MNTTPTPENSPSDKKSKPAKPAKEKKAIRPARQWKQRKYYLSNIYVSLQITEKNNEGLSLT